MTIPPPPQESNKTCDYVCGLLRQGISKERIFIVPDTLCKARGVVFLPDGELSKSCRPVSEVKPVLRYLDYHVTDFCNLKCKYCLHMADSVRDMTFADINEFRHSLEKLKTKFSNINVMYLLGGEPFLCRNLHEYIYALHDNFPLCKIRITSNGLLYKNITQETFQAMRVCSVTVQITQYPPTRKIIDDLMETFSKNDVNLEILEPLTEFYRMKHTGKKSRTQKYYECLSKYCHFMHDSHVYPCPTVWVKHNFNNLIEDGIDDDEHDRNSFNFKNDIKEDGWDIIMKLEEPFEVCDKCGDDLVFSKWESTVGQNNY